MKKIWNIYFFIIPLRLICVHCPSVFYFNLDGWPTQSRIRVGNALVRLWTMNNEGLWTVSWVKSFANELIVLIWTFAGKGLKANTIKEYRQIQIKIRKTYYSVLMYQSEWILSGVKLEKYKMVDTKFTL